MGVSRRAYAKHRGCAENAVRKAIAAGRITLEPDGTIDPDKADAQWAARTDPAQRRKPDHGPGPVGANGSAAPADEDGERAVPRAAFAAINDALGESGNVPAPAKDGGGTDDDSTFVKAKTANEVLKAQRQRLLVEKEKGKLVDRAKATTTVYTLARRERDAWVGWPARVAALVAGELEVDAHRVETVLEKYVRQHLAELGDVKVQLGGDD